jgi:hypothetical protein
MIVFGWDFFQYEKAAVGSDGASSKGGVKAAHDWTVGGGTGSCSGVGALSEFLKVRIRLDGLWLFVL